MKSSLPSPLQTQTTSVSPFAQIRHWFQQLNGETRTRILLLYSVTMLVVFGTSIPIFRYFLFTEVNNRVRDNLEEEVEKFETAYDRWDAETDNSVDAIQAFADDFMSTNIPEDDNFQIVILQNKLYRTNLAILPEVIGPESDLFQEWLTLDVAQEATVPSNDPTVGSIIYRTSLLEVNDVPVGLFVDAHLSAGEQSEALAGVYVFIKVAVGVLVGSLLLAWLGSKRLLQPVQQLSQTAKEINETNLSERLSVNGSGELADLAKTFNTMMDRVQSAFDTQRNFINDASHELRTPLTIIQGHLELMGDDPEEQQETLSLVMDEIGRMGRFVNDLLLLTKAEQPNFLQDETINAAQFMDEVYSKITTLGDRAWELTSTAKGTFVADRQRITGVIVNLAQNAVQHTQQNDMIEFGSEQVKGYVRFWVRDTGAGIAPADQTRIFDRFARAANTYRKSEGAGLGLAIVKSIAEAHHGHIKLTSQLGLGATFSLFLPTDDAARTKRL
ncbi:MAG: HAMP domain-containing sensor histidine kinase [Cyanobacteria bacterium P01_F01_bin.56]